jgi:hypothetical protein
MGCKDGRKIQKVSFLSHSWKTFIEIAKKEAKKSVLSLKY